MFYLSDRLNGKYGVTDTSDNTTEYYTLDDIISFVKRGIDIKGVNLEINKFELLTPVSAKLFELKAGTPLRIKLSKTLPEKQVIYSGMRFDASKRTTIFALFDDSGVTGYFGLSARYLFEGKDTISIDLENNDAMEVARLVEKLRR